VAGIGEGPQLPEPPPPRLGVERFVAPPQAYDSYQPSAAIPEDSPARRGRSPFGLLAAAVIVVLAIYFVVVSLRH
jgi:hypothetical protein